ncbi:MAG: hypothetical protein WA804_23410 [Terriglobales bacterium]
MTQETEVAVTVRKLHELYGVGDIIGFKKSDGKYEVLDAHTSSNDDGTLTVHYQIKRVGA